MSSTEEFESTIIDKEEEEKDLVNWEYERIFIHMTPQYSFPVYLATDETINELLAFANDIGSNSHKFFKDKRVYDAKDEDENHFRFFVDQELVNYGSRHKWFKFKEGYEFIGLDAIVAFLFFIFKKSKIFSSRKEIEDHIITTIRAARGNYRDLQVEEPQVQEPQVQKPIRESMRGQIMEYYVDNVFSTYVTFLEMVSNDEALIYFANYNPDPDLPNPRAVPSSSLRFTMGAGSQSQLKLGDHVEVADSNCLWRLGQVIRFDTPSQKLYTIVESRVNGNGEFIYHEETPFNLIREPNTRPLKKIKI